MLAADEHPGAFLEDEVPFAPRAAEAAPASAPPGQDPGGWFQRWRVPVTALFVVLIALAVALAFGAKPDPPPTRAPLGSAPVTAASVGDPPRSASTGAPVDTVASPPPAAPALPVTSAGGPVASPTASGPASTVTTVPASATSVVTSPASPVTASSPTRPSTSATWATSATTVTAPPSPTTAPTTAVPGYATGSTQARGPNDPPFIANPGLVTSTVGQTTRYQIGVSARPGEVLTFSATGLPRRLSIDPATGLVTGIPDKAQTTGVQVTVTSSAGSRFTQGFTWVVDR